MKERWDAVVVGAGPAGALVTERLLSRGLRVALLESGPRLEQGHRAPEVDRRQWAYSSAELTFDWYRVRAVGGRTLQWGGWSHRFPAAVFERAGWPYGADTLAPYYDELEQRLGVVEGALDARYSALARALGVSIVPKRGALGRDGQPWTPVRSTPGRRARTHQVALRLEHRRGRASAVTCFDLRTEKVRTLEAAAVVLSASPIETARILLESSLGPRSSRIGRGLVDHMVASYVLLEPAPAPGPQGRGAFPGQALVESFVNDGRGPARVYPGGFSIELSGPLRPEALNLERMVSSQEWRATQIHALGECFPSRERWVELDPTTRDALGRPVPRIHVDWNAADHALASEMTQACTQIADALAIPGSRLVRFADPLQPGAGHEAGTCAMGLDDGAPADPWGRLRALENVWVADASALPTAGDRHPTLTLLGHALRAADSAAGYLASSTALAGAI